MRITYRTLAKLIDLMTDEQKDSDLTVEIPDEMGDNECFAAELRIADDNHDSLANFHPVIFANTDHDGGARTNDIANIVKRIGLNDEQAELERNTSAPKPIRTFLAPKEN